ncbi:hypothetical protein NDU88_006748 [Pleurodeles waltl]|uniref:Uncharacterized protein n=1 Tax=Pleurodeles waltl TaxID=8319 RepID=A0AAV7RND3_PLEWA|nr:hypothetical protein NDU88_006748 [Pleurodeles waltl]
MSGRPGGGDGAWGVPLNRRGGGPEAHQGEEVGRRCSGTEEASLGVGPGFTGSTGTRESYSGAGAKSEEGIAGNSIRCAVAHVAAVDSCTEHKSEFAPVGLPHAAVGSLQMLRLIGKEQLPMFGA